MREIINDINREEIKKLLKTHQCGVWRNRIGVFLLEGF